MIIFYNKKTKEIYGTEDSYGNPRVFIKPPGVDKDDVAWKILDKEFEEKNTSIVKDITRKILKNVDALEFEDDPKKNILPKPKEDNGCDECGKDKKFVEAMRQIAREELQKLLKEQKLGNV